MARRKRSASLLRESQVLARGAAHVLEVLKNWHPDRDDVRIALRCTLELEAALTAEAHEDLGPSGIRVETRPIHADVHRADASREG